MTLTIRRLGPGDDALLRRLALEDAQFDLEGRSRPLQPLSALQSQRYLANPAVLHWVASEGSTPVGFLLCHLLPMRSGEGQELLLYEIGVRQTHRRAGVGRALMEAMTALMAAQALRVVWVLADNPGAVGFYRACGFELEAEQPTYLTRTAPAS